MSLSLTALRSHLFGYVDEVIRTGIPLEIKRKGHIVKIVVEKPKSKLDNLVKRDGIVGDPEDLVDLHIPHWNLSKFDDL
ncbi:hypothetical protein MNB_SUP05-SYMBIONT-4-1042 [hydrothermal vent metagenome]|uniref:Antitoxin n=1 Tax=hydrothermal vent metagenome TaxID=652676 RepID=A0A1W1DYG2_9ZZZZ